MFTIRWTGLGQPQPLLENEKIWIDRDSPLFNPPPPIVAGANFLRTCRSFAGNPSNRVAAVSPGTLLVLTADPDVAEGNYSGDYFENPGLRNNRSSFAAGLEQMGFARVPNFVWQMFGSASDGRAVLYRKSIAPGDEYVFSTWTVILGFDRMIRPRSLPDSPGENGEILSNGIILPKVWPPVNLAADDPGPMRIPYLEHPPRVIGIDSGRQLFVDDFLIESSDLKTVYHHPVKYPGNPVLRPETDLEKGIVGRNATGNAAATVKSGGCWFDEHEGCFKLWYEAGWLGVAAMAKSFDGIHWERPVFDVRPGTNQVLPDDPLLRTDSWTVWRDDATTDENQRYKMFLTTPGGSYCYSSWVLASPDGVHWTRRVKAFTMGDRTTMHYNPFRKKWIVSYRAAWNGARSRVYRECDDIMREAVFPMREAVPWLTTDRLDRCFPDELEQLQQEYLRLHGCRVAPALYNFDAAAYESIMLGMFELYCGPENDVCEKTGLPKITHLQFAYSRDGFHYSRPDRTPAIRAEGWESSAWDKGYIQPLGNVCVVRENEIYFYYCGFAGNPARRKCDLPPDTPWFSHGYYDRSATGLAILRRDGFASLETPPDASGTVTTRLLRSRNRRLFLNLDAPGGTAVVELLDDRGRSLPGYAAEDAVPVSGDRTRARVEWRGADELPASGPLRFRFRLRNAKLYSFWTE